MKLLAINFGGIGDEILFLPTLATIRKERPRWQITLLVEPRSASIAEVTDLIDDLIAFDIKKRPLSVADALSLVTMLRDRDFDAVLSSGSSVSVPVLLFLTGIKTRVAYGATALARLLITNPVPLNREQYAAWMYHDLVRGLGLTSAPGPVSIKTDPERVRNMAGVLGLCGTDTAGSAGLPLVLLHPGMSKLALQKAVMKNWSPRSWASLIEALCLSGLCHVVLCGGPDDREAIAEIEAIVEQSGRAPASGRFQNAYGRTRCLADLAALIQLASVVVAVDSAPMHMAVALDRPLVALFGPTDEKKLLPACRRFIALRAPGSRPDAAAFSKPSGRPGCGSPRHDEPSPGVLIQPDTVFQAVLDQLSQATARENSPESCP